MWPHDTSTSSAELQPLCAATFLGPVKLYDFDTVLAMLGELSLTRTREKQRSGEGGFDSSRPRTVEQSKHALRVLRFRNPTLFASNALLVCFAGAVTSSYFSGRAIVVGVCYAALLLPGWRRRKILEKCGGGGVRGGPSFTGVSRIAMRLSASPLGRRLVDTFTIGENPNLEETNTTQVLSFVNELAERKKTPPAMTVKAAD